MNLALIDYTVRLADADGLISASNPLPVDSGAGAPTPGTQETLQSAATATGNGTAIDIDGYTHLGVQVTGTFVATITFEISMDGGTTYFTFHMRNVNNTGSTFLATPTSPIAVFAPLDFIGTHFRARISAYTSGSITVKSIKHTR